MGKIERIIAAVAAFLTIATGAFFIYDRFRSEGDASKPAEPAQTGTTPAGAMAAPVATASDAAAKPASPASAPQTDAASAAPKQNPAAASAVAKTKAQLVFLCDGRQSGTFTPGRNPNPVLERFENVPPNAEAIFDFSDSKQSGTAEVLIRGQGMEWSAYRVAVELAGQRSLYGATGTNAQPNGLNFAERGEVNLETSEWTSTRVIRTGAQRGPQAEVKIVGKCSALESPKPKPSDAPPQWQIEAKFIPMPR